MVSIGPQGVGGEETMLYVEELEQMFSLEKRQMIWYMLATLNICLAVTWQRG